MQPHTINKLATWLKMREDGILVKKMPEGYPYSTKAGITMQSSIVKPVYRYAKNYSVGKKTFSLCLITLNPNAQEVEAWLDNQSEFIDLEKVERPFTSLDIYYDN